jgi:hypothetical protein
VRVTLALLLLCAACGSERSVDAETLDRVLDAITEMAAPAQETIRDGCNSRENAAAELATIDAARAEVARVRATCDVVFAAFGILREAQVDARAAAQASRDGSISAEQALQAALRVRTSYQALRSAIDGLEARR